MNPDASRGALAAATAFFIRACFRCTGSRSAPCRRGSTSCLARSVQLAFGLIWVELGLFTGEALWRYRKGAATVFSDMAAGE